jgi:hypothetical protein
MAVALHNKEQSMMSTFRLATCLHGTACSILAQQPHVCAANVDPVTAGAPKRQVVRMGNKGAGGPFAPLVVVVRGVVGEKEFNKLRGKAISLHSQGET